MAEEHLNYIAESPEEGERIDTYISKKSDKVSRTHAKKLIDEGNVTVNEKVIKSSYKVKKDDIINIVIPEPETLKVEAEDIDIDIIYEDNDICVVNKPQGMVVHPAAGNYTGTLVNALLKDVKIYLQ